MLVSPLQTNEYQRQKILKVFREKRHIACRRMKIIRRDLSEAMQPADTARMLKY